MRRARKPVGQRGMAALEMVLVLPVLLLFLAWITFFGRYFWHYTAAHKAAHDAARYLATVPQREMKTPGLGGGQAPVTQVAQAIAVAETTELNPGPFPPSVLVSCLPQGCSGLVLPAKVRVLVMMRMTDDLFAPVTRLLLGDEGLLLTADVTMLYVGG